MFGLRPRWADRRTGRNDQTVEQAMTRTNVLNTATINFLELIGNGKTYLVPPYQRDYAWTEEAWEDFWNDVLDLRRQADGRHYMGALVVQGRTDREFTIIDGQQRLATLSILSLAVIHKLHRMAAEEIDRERNLERANELRNRFVGEKDPASLIESSRLNLSRTDDAFYQDYLVRLRPPLNPRGLPRSNTLLWECFRYFSERLDELDDVQEDGEALARILSETTARGLLFILITVEDEFDAYTVFETLNARGLELTTADLLKNYLFSKVRVQGDLDALQRRWQALIATVTQERFSEFLRHHLLCEQAGIRCTDSASRRDGARGVSLCLHGETPTASGPPGRAGMAIGFCMMIKRTFSTCFNSQALEPRAERDSERTCARKPLAWPGCL